MQTAREVPKQIIIIQKQKHHTITSVSLKVTNTPYMLVENRSCAPLGLLLVSLSSAWSLLDASGLFLGSFWRVLGASSARLEILLAPFRPLRSYLRPLLDCITL